ncbi:MAG: hypothetical protein NTY47_03820, partial [Candidatus Omnitrophica bacterium]|nr:hypothetical protein [Candidatus Omnitrophota bacterium]
MVRLLKKAVDKFKHRNPREGLVTGELTKENAEIQIIESYRRNLSKVSNPALREFIGQLKTVQESVRDLQQEKSDLLDRKEEVANHPFENDEWEYERFLTLRELDHKIAEVDTKIQAKVRAHFGVGSVVLNAGLLSPEIRMGSEMAYKLFPDFEVLSVSREATKALKDINKADKAQVAREIIGRLPAAQDITESYIRTKLDRLSGLEGTELVKSILEIALLKAKSDMAMVRDNAKEDPNNGHLSDGEFNEKFPEFDPGTAEQQLGMVFELLRENSVLQRVSGGKTLALSTEMLVRGVIGSRSGIGINQILVVKPGEADQTFNAGIPELGGKGSIKLRDLFRLFGFELVNGNELCEQRAVGERDLISNLVDTKAIVIIDQANLGFLSLRLNEQLREALRLQAVVRYDEFHLPFSSRTTYITANTSTPLEEKYVTGSLAAKEKIDRIMQNGIEETRDISLARNEEAPRFYSDKSKWGLNNKA